MVKVLPTQLSLWVPMPAPFTFPLPCAWNGNSSTLSIFFGGTAPSFSTLPKPFPGPPRDLHHTLNLRVVFLPGPRLIDFNLKTRHQATFSLSTVTFVSTFILVSHLLETGACKWHITPQSIAFGIFRSFWVD